MHIGDGPAIFTDGGVIRVNPSPVGGTWAWCLVEDGEQRATGSGVIAPRGRVAQITNNQTELLAIVRALEAMPSGWTGTLCSDSATALGWTFLGYRNDKAPPALIARFEAARKRLGRIQIVHLAGHPSIADLKRGYKVKPEKGGRRWIAPVSRWNRWCDEACTAAGAEFVETKRRLES